MSSLLELERQGYTFMFDPDADLPSGLHRNPIAFYKKNDIYTAIYSEEEINRLDSEATKYIRLEKKKEKPIVNQNNSHLRIGNIDEEVDSSKIGKYWRDLKYDDRLALLDAQCYCVQKAKETSFYPKAIQTLIIIGIDLGFTEEFIKEKVNNIPLEEISISRRLSLIENKDTLAVVFKSCLSFAVNTNDDWTYVFEPFMNAGCSIEELSSWTMDIRGL